MLSVRNLSKIYEVKKSVFAISSTKIKALDSVSFELKDGETLGVVGESGSGKSTLARCILLLERPDSGSIRFKGIDILKLKGKDFKSLRKEVQIVFQDPYSSLNPRKRVIDIISEPILNFSLEQKERIKERVTGILMSVGLDVSFMYKYPHEMSGGQRQRIAIARALATEPSLLVADEPVSSLDVSIQAQILSLLLEVKKKNRLSMIFISHDLNVVRFVSERIIVMFKGKVLEEGGRDEIFSNPLHPYTRMLIAYSKGEPMPVKIESGEGASCVYYQKCPYRIKRCISDQPVLFGTDGHKVACFLEGGN
ncbi:MAG: ATP-binding cassette domain-containing protein [Deltaproteobacteria bacterium]|nr:ATP-binding cassette domain-containing protein [Deltaproteobacteria bacterium]